MRLLLIALRYIYPLSCAFVPCALYQIMLYRKWKHHGRVAKGNLLWRYIFFFYLILVMWAVGMGNIWDIVAYGAQINWSQINLVPFGSEAMLTYILNVVLFMPLGFLLPMIWSKCRRLSCTVTAGILLSLSIELGQLFNHRVTDVDDILMNALGTFIGFGLWYLLHKRYRMNTKEANIFPDNPMVYLILTVLGSFLLDNWRLTVMFFSGHAR